MGIHQCKDCGSTDIRNDRSLGGRLVCIKCGSFTIGFKQRRNNGKKVYQGYRSLSSGITVSRDDWQYLIPFLICLIAFIATDILGLFDKSNIVYWSGGLLAQPHRILTAHFFHGDFGHLLLNTGGIIIARNFFRTLGLSNRSFFLILIAFLIPLQVSINWFYDIFVARNPMSLALGFSGIIYGIDAFILLASIYGKQTFLGVQIGLSRNYQCRQTMTILTVMGVLYSFAPGISLMGHLSGFAAGAFLFLL